METIYALRDPGKPGNMLLCCLPRPAPAPTRAPITDTAEKLERQTADPRWYEALIHPFI